MEGLPPSVLRHLGWNSSRSPVSSSFSINDSFPDIAKVSLRPETYDATMETVSQHHCGIPVNP